MEGKTTTLPFANCFKIINFSYGWLVRHSSGTFYDTLFCWWHQTISFFKKHCYCNKSGFVRVAYRNRPIRFRGTAVVRHRAFFSSLLPSFFKSEKSDYFLLLLNLAHIFFLYNSPMLIKRVTIFTEMWSARQQTTIIFFSSSKTKAGKIHFYLLWLKK